MAKKYKKKFGDRKDARRVREYTGMTQLNMDFKPGRCNSDVYINQKMDLTILSEYLEKKKKEGHEITYFHAFLTAIGRVYHLRPVLNYFVANRHLYEHNEVAISFVAKVSFDDKAEEMMVMIEVEDDDNIFTISQKCRDKVEAFRSKKVEQKDGANKAIDTLGHLPNMIRVPVMGLFKWLDKHGHLPSSLIKDNLYYSSLIVSNLGALKCGAIYHNMVNFGTASGLATMGEVKEEVVLDKDGNKKVKKMCEFGINLDERIGDGYYFVKSVHLLQYIFDHPELMEENSNEKIEVPEIR